MIIKRKEKVAIVGGGGFLGRGLVEVLAKDYDIRIIEVVDLETEHEKFIGDVSNPGFCLEVTKGVDLLVVAHMSPRPCDTPYGPFNANVTGTANLLYSAHVNKVRRVCVISSVDAVAGEIKFEGKKHDVALRPSAVDIYSATKACQEIIAETFHRCYGLETAALRIGYVVDGDALVDKYNNDLSELKGGMIDPIDCGMIIEKIFKLAELTYKVFYVYSAFDEDTIEGAPICGELNWKSRFTA